MVRLALKDWRVSIGDPVSQTKRLVIEALGQTPRHDVKKRHVWSCVMIALRPWDMVGIEVRDPEGSGPYPLRRHYSPRCDQGRGTREQEVLPHVSVPRQLPLTDEAVLGSWLMV